MNKSRLLECISTLAFGLWLIFLLVSGQYKYYIAPKLMPALLITSLPFLIWAMLQIPTLKQPSYRKGQKTYMVFLLPLFIFIYPHSPDTSSQVIAQRYLSLSQIAESSDSIFEKFFVPSKPQSPKLPSNPSPVPQADKTPDLEESPPGLDREKRSIQVEDSYFYQWMLAFFNSPDLYKGYELELKGFVYHQEQFQSDLEFVIARHLMSCCVADLTIIGLKSDYPKPLADKQWYLFKGHLIYIQTENGLEPQLKIESIEPSTPPEEPYLYPY